MLFAQPYNLILLYFCALYSYFSISYMYPWASHLYQIYFIYIVPSFLIRSHRQVIYIRYIFFTHYPSFLIRSHRQVIYTRYIFFPQYPHFLYVAMGKSSISDIFSLHSTLISQICEIFELFALFEMSHF